MRIQTEWNMDQEKDKKNTEKLNSKIFQTVSEFMKQYGRYIGAGLVVVLLLVVCVISLVDRYKHREINTGVMMTIADVTKEKKAFYCKYGR